MDSNRYVESCPHCIIAGPRPDGLAPHTDHWHTHMVHATREHVNKFGAHLCQGCWDYLMAEIEALLAEVRELRFRVIVLEEKSTGEEEQDGLH